MGLTDVPTQAPSVASLQSVCLVCVQEAAVGHLELRRAPRRRGGRIMHVEIHPLLGRQGSAPPPGAARHKKMMRGGRFNEALATGLHGEDLIDAGEEREERPAGGGRRGRTGEEEPLEREERMLEGIREKEVKKREASKKRMRVRRGG